MHLCKCMHGWIERETPGDKTSNFKVVGLKFRNTPEGKDYSRQCGGDVQKAHIHTNRPTDGHFWESTDFPTSPRARRVDAANRHIKDGGRGQPPKIGESSYAAPLDEEMIASMLPPGKFKAFKEKRSGATKSTRRSNASKPNKPKGKGNGKSGHADKVNALFGGLQCMMHFDLEKLRCLQHEGQLSAELNRRSTLRALNSDILTKSKLERLESLFEDSEVVKAPEGEAQQG